MSYSLFIDDERDPIDVKWGSWEDQLSYKTGDWIIARNWLDVLEIIVSLGIPNTISFDHDLGKDQPTGYEIAKRVSDMVMDGVKLPENFNFMVHSKNPVGAENIRVYMNNFIKSQKER